MHECIHSVFSHVATAEELDSALHSMQITLAIPLYLSSPAWLEGPTKDTTVPISLGHKIVLLEEWRLGHRSSDDKLWWFILLRHPDRTHRHGIRCTVEQWRFLWETNHVECARGLHDSVWWPAITMPSWASRFSLTVTELGGIREGVDGGWYQYVVAEPIQIE